jgi:hypothetical protein
VIHLSFKANSIATAKVQFRSTGSADLVCVNIGRRVKSDGDSAKPNERLMREQSEHGAQWIPACLLQIMPGQVVKTTLGSNHTKEMIKHALRLSTENLGLIEEEGLEIIGVKTQSGQQPLVSLNEVLMV